jgi:hypothetical protein
MGIQTEFEFTLPKGYVDENGTLHRNGVMRLATAADEILPLKDQNSQRKPAYKTALLLSKVVVKLGNLRKVDASVICGLYASDLAYLQSFYNKINGQGVASLKVASPVCRAKFEVEPDDGSE